MPVWKDWVSRRCPLSCQQKQKTEMECSRKCVWWQASCLLGDLHDVQRMHTQLGRIWYHQRHYQLGLKGPERVQNNGGHQNSERSRQEIDCLKYTTENRQVMKKEWWSGRQSLEPRMQSHKTEYYSQGLKSNGVCLSGLWNCLAAVTITSLTCSPLLSQNICVTSDLSWYCGRRVIGDFCTDVI